MKSYSVWGMTSIKRQGYLSTPPSGMGTFRTREAARKHIRKLFARGAVAYAALYESFAGRGGKIVEEYDWKHLRGRPLLTKVRGSR